MTGSFDGSFATDPAAGSIVGAESDCYTLSGFSGADSVLVATSLSAADGSSPVWTLVDGNGTTICGHYVNRTGTRCHLSGSAPWSLRISDSSSGQNGSFSYSAVVRRLTSPQGCSSLGKPGEWSFDSPRIDGSIDDPLDSQCFTFSRAPGEADASYWLQSVRAAGDFLPVWTVYGPTGSEECNGSSGGVESGCKLLASGQFALVVRDQGGDRTGSFFITAKRLSTPGGCGTLSSLSYGAVPSSDSIATAGEADCHLLPDVEQGDVVSVGFNVSGASGANARWTLLDGNGAYVCDWSSAYYTSTCTLGGAAGWYLAVFDYSGSGTFSYSAAVRRVNDPQGCSPLGDPAIWSFTAGRVNGSVPGSLAAQCFTFSRAADEPDGSYWFRTIRSSGNLAPEWKVYGPGGSLECSGTAGPADGCKLLATGQFSLVVKDQSGTQTGSYLATAKRLTTRLGCSALTSIAFGAAPVASSVASAGEADCHSLPNVVSGDAVTIDFTASGLSNASPRWTVVDGTGSGICDSTSYGYYGLCTLSGSAGWSLLIYDAAGSGTFSYAAAVRRLTDPQGCSPLGDPAVWSFTAPRSNGSIDGPLDTRCFTFSRTFGEPDASYWFRTLRTSGQLQPGWSVYGPTGSRECRGSNEGVQGRCRLQASGQFAFVVADQGGQQSGSYLATAKRLSEANGCAPLPTVAFGIPATKGNLSTAGEIDCYALSASAGDLLKFTTSGSADQLALVDPEGEVVCMSWNTCAIDDDGQFSVLLYSSAGTSGAYQLEAACENVPCGQSNTAVTDVTPNRVGPSEFTSVLLRGRDLELLDSASISRGGQTRIAAVGQAGPDGRALELRFDLDGAALGPWDLTATFIDGTTRVLSGAVRVEAARVPRITTQLIGRGVFRAGRPTSITVEVANSGNVDGVAVPLVLSGIPDGSTIEPRFDFAEPQGDLGSPTLVDTSFDQTADTLLLDDGIAVPVMIPRVPAGRPVQLEYEVTAPAIGSSYTLQAAAGQCWGNPRPDLSPEGAAIQQAEGDRVTRAINFDDVFSCAKDVGSFIGQVALGKFPLIAQGVSCFSAGGEIGAAIARGIVLPGFFDVHGAKVISMRNAIDFGVNSAGCVVPGLSWVKKTQKAVVEKAGLVVAGIEANASCWVPLGKALLPQQLVGAFDPNDIIGPAGVGANRYIPGDQALDYQVLFENKPDATAPAQRIEVTDQLDTSKFDPDTVLFHGVRFGSTNLTLPYPSASVDETIDLRPTQNLQVHFTAGVTTGGKVHFELQAIDPDTFEPPDDPAAGFLPANVDAPEGEGMLEFSVTPRDDLDSGTVLSNGASIIFDENAPILTPTWSNVVDREPPSVSLGAEPAGQPLAADISWGGSDDAAGITLWMLEVSRDGGPYRLWRTASAPGFDAFVAPAGGNYGFRATAYDGAGNLGRSALMGVALSTSDAGGGGSGESPGDPAFGSGGPASVPPTAISPQAGSVPRTPKCRKGFRKKSARGKAKCVKGKAPRKAKKKKRG